MTDLLGPADAAGAVTARPSDSRVFGGSDTWIKDCTSPTAKDGTKITAAYLNGLLAQIRRAIRGMSVAENNADDDMLLKAIKAAVAGYVTEGQLEAAMPIFPMVGTGGVITYTTSTGQIVVDAGIAILHRGFRSVSTTDFDAAARTFATLANKTYHLRWDAPGTGLATPRASYPKGRLVLRDLADAAYNPSAVGEGNAAFDTAYDSALLARVVTNGSNALTVTALANKPRLTGSGTRSSTSSPATTDDYTLNWSRTPDNLGISNLQESPITLGNQDGQESNINVTATRYVLSVFNFSVGIDGVQRLPYYTARAAA